MKVKRVDGELYVDKETKVFFDDEKIPKKFEDKTKYSLVIIKRSKGVNKTRNGTKRY